MGKKAKIKGTGLPLLFLDRLKAIVPPGQLDAVIDSFSAEGLLSFRVNTLKAQKQSVIENLKERNIAVKEVPWLEEALILSGTNWRGLEELELIKKGHLYRQGLSSMLPVLALNPNPGEYVLDMCAAPGSKTTQMAAMMGHAGEIVALEAVSKRYYKLKSVLALLGAVNVSAKIMDARRFKHEKLFDRVLADVPCSSEGRFQTGHPKTYAYWSLRKIREMVRKQRGILLNGSRLLKPGGVMVYSTCTFAPEENEGVVDWLLRKMKGALAMDKIDIPGIQKYPAVTQWQGKNFDPQVKGCCRVLPGAEMEGFFITKFVKAI